MGKKIEFVFGLIKEGLIIFNALCFLSLEKVILILVLLIGLTPDVLLSTLVYFFL